jgi:hypothetical protein
MTTVRWLVPYAAALLLALSLGSAMAQFVGPPQNIAADSDANQPFALHVKTFGADTVATTFAPGSSVVADQGAPAIQANRWPVFLSDGAAALLGQKTMAGSLPVAIASNQSPVSIEGGNAIPVEANIKSGITGSYWNIVLGVGDVRVINPTWPLGLTYITGQQAVTTTATSLGATSTKIVCVKVLESGTQNVFYGSVSGVTTSTGQQLIPGEGVCRPITNLSVVFVIAAGAGSTVASCSSGSWYIMYQRGARPPSASPRRRVWSSRMKRCSRAAPARSIAPGPVSPVAWRPAWPP